MESNEIQNMFSSLDRIVKKRKWLVWSCIAAVIGPIILYNEMTQPIYEAYTTLIFEDFSDPVTSYNYDFSKDVFFTNQIEEIHSYSFAKDIVKSLSDDILDQFGLPDSGEQHFNKMEYIITDVQENISAYPVRKSNIIRISFQASDPLLSKTVTEMAAIVLQKRNNEIKKEGVGAVREFIDNQLERYKNQLNMSETSLKDFKERHRVTSVDREVQEIMRRITEAEILFNTLKADRRSTEEQLLVLENRLAEQEKVLVPNLTDIGSPWAQKLRERLMDLSMEYMNLQIQGYPQDHPKMIELKLNMKKIQKDLTERMLRLSKGENLTNPIAQIEKYVEETLDLEIKLEALKAGEEALNTMISGYNQELVALPNKEFMLAKLIRERDVNHKIYVSLLEKREDARISEAEHVKHIRIIDQARVPELPVIPRKKVNLAIGLLMGFFLGVVSALIIELTNNNVESPSEIEKITRWPVLATIPKLDLISNGKLRRLGNSNDNSYHEIAKNDQFRRALISRLRPTTGSAEIYRMLATNLQFRGVGDQHKTLLFTSIGPGDGKSTTLSNLALCFAASGKETVIVDADPVIPMIHRFFGLRKENGLTDLLGTLNEAFLFRPVNNTISGPETQSPRLRCIVTQALKNTKFDNLSVLSSGPELNNPSAIPFTRLIPILLQKIKQQSSIILIDSGPLLLVNNTLILASQADAVILIVQSNKYEREMFTKAKILLKAANANVIGAVVNNFELEGSYKKCYGRYYANKK